MVAWQALEFTSDPIEAVWHGDPGVLWDALGELLAAVAPPAWHQQAACRDKGPAAWFPERGKDPRPAKTSCSGCPVRDDCLAAGMTERHGIWGGQSERGRRIARRVSPVGDAA